MFHSMIKPIRWLTAAVLLLLSAQCFANSNHIQPGIVAHPKSVLVEAGKPASLAILLKGQIKSIQWRKNGQPIEGAQEKYLETEPVEIKLPPDHYDAVVQDVFGNIFVSEQATVAAAKIGSAALVEQNRRYASLKMQSLFNLIQLFDQVAARVREPLQDWKIKKTSVERIFPECPSTAKMDWVEPANQPGLAHQAVKIELDSCFVPKTDRFGGQNGALIKGQYIHSVKTSKLPDKEIVKIEQIAKNLSLRFPHTLALKNFQTADFDVILNGKLTQQTETVRISTHSSSTRQEYTWNRGTTIENPQTGVKAEFISGKYIRATFATHMYDEIQINRETELFDNLKLKIGGEYIVIHGMVTTINDGSLVHRSGEFKISVNGKLKLNTSSAISPPSDFDGNLPNAPKLNGFFVNDYQTTKSRKVIKMVTPDQPFASKFN